MNDLLLDLDLADATLLATRLTLPPLRPLLVERQRLRTELLAGFAQSLTLVTAPAGSGKTTLLVQAIAEAQRVTGLRCAWLSLDEGDNDPARYWRYFVAALNRAAPGVGTRALDLLQSMPGRSIEPVLTVLINALAVLADPLVLALDDYHLIDTPEIHAGMAFLLDHTPPQFRLVIASRSLPPLPLERLRVRGRLVELHAADLRFTLPEATTLLAEVMGLALPPAAVTTLVERTEGWGAGLILAALAARGRNDPAAYAAAFSGASPAVFDYVAAEVLQRQSPELRHFVLHTALLDRFCAELCATVIALAVWPEPSAALPTATVQENLPSAQAMLEQLERANLFLVSLDDERRWFRYHHLFAAALRSRLERSDPALTRAIRLHAAAWFAAHGMPAEALGYVLAAQDWDQAAQLIGETGRAMLMRSEVATLRRWLGLLPTSVLEQHPRLLLLDGWLLVLLSNLAAAEERMDRVTLATTDEDLLDELRVMRATVAVLRGDILRASDLAILPRERLPQNPFLHAIAALNRGFPAHFSGDVRAAVQAYSEAVQIAQASGNLLITFIAWCQLGEVQELQGQLRAAEASYQHGRELLQSSVAGVGQLTDSALIGLAGIARERGHPAEAEQLICAGLSNQPVLSDIAAVDAYLHLAEIAADRGDAPAAWENLNSAMITAQALHMAMFVETVAAHRARLAVRLGDHATALDWLAQNEQFKREEQPALLIEISDLTRARVLNALGRYAEVLPLLDQTIAAAEAAGRGRSVIEALILRAVALEGYGKRQAALEALAQAQRLAAPEGFVRLFADEGPVLDRLVALLAEQSNPTPALPAAQASDLTERELEVLQLIAAGMNNSEIAQQLVVAPSTVKKHINRIFAKLEAGSRTQALVRARTLGLLPRA